MERRFKGRGLPMQTYPGTTPQPRPETPSSLKGLILLLDVGNVGRWGIRGGNTHFKRKRAVQTGECLNSPRELKRYSSVDQPTQNIT